MSVLDFKAISKAAKPMSVYLQRQTDLEAAEGKSPISDKPTSEPDSKTLAKSPEPTPSSMETESPLLASAAAASASNDPKPHVDTPRPPQSATIVVPKLSLDLLDEKQASDHVEPPAPKRRRRGRPPKNVWSNAGESSTASSAESEWRTVTFRAKKKAPKKKSKS